MSAQDELLVKNEYDDNSDYQDYKDEEKSDINRLNESSAELTTIKNSNGDNIPIYLRLAKRILFCSGKYFYIEHTTDQMTGIITTCHTCGVRIKGSLKISSNFITHLKARHPEVYKNFLIEKQAGGSWTTNKRCNNRASPYPNNVTVGSNTVQYHENHEKLFHRNVLQFLTATNQSLSLVENVHFRKLFEFVDSSISLKTQFQYEQMIKSYCKCKQWHIATIFARIENKICLTWDAWSLEEWKYIAVSGHWIDEQYQRQTAVLACIRSSNSERNCLQGLLNDVMLRYGLKKEYIVKTVTGNIQNYTRSFVEFGVNSEILCIDYSVDKEDILLKQMERNLELLNINTESEIKVSQLDILRLYGIWGSVFTNNPDSVTSNLHRSCLEKCSLIWKVCLKTRFKEYFTNILNGSLTPPNLFCFSSLYTSLKQLLVNKNKLAQICVFCESPDFCGEELEYLEELVDIFEPINAAFEFLDMPENHLYGCFLPTLVTLKWKLTRLHNSKKLNHLQEPLIKLKEQLLSEFQLYYELNDAKSEAILAAITYPQIKTRFLTGLQDTTSSAYFKAKNLLLKYGKDYHVVGSEQADDNVVESSVLTSTLFTNFFDFGDNTENIAGEYIVPSSLKLEIDKYLTDNDIALTSLHKYPTIKRMFFHYNTCIPSPSSVIRLFPLQKILRTSLLTSCTHEQFEDYIFYQCHTLNK